MEKKKVRVEISLFDPYQFCLGVFTAKGGDDHGDFNLLIIGFLLFDISIYSYIQEE